MPARHWYRCPVCGQRKRLAPPAPGTHGHWCPCYRPDAPTRMERVALDRALAAAIRRTLGLRRQPDRTHTADK